MNGKIQAIHLNFKILFVITLNINLKNSMMSEERSHRGKKKFISKHMFWIHPTMFSLALGTGFLHFHFALGLTNDVARSPSPRKGKEIFSNLEGLKRSATA